MNLLDPHDWYWLIPIALFAVTLAGLVKGAMGVGMGMVALPILSLIIPPTQAIGLIVVPVLMSNFVQVVEHGQFVYTAKRFRWILVVQLVVLTVTVHLASGLSTEDMRDAFACVVLFAVVLMASRLRVHIKPSQEVAAGIVAGAIAGVMGGISSMTGPVLITYLMALQLKREEFVGSISVIYLINSLVMYTAMMWVGNFGVYELLMSCVGLLPMWLGMIVGKKIRMRLSEKAFRAALLLFLSGLALTLLLK
jgi:uncharacterized membrane protein YfcA